MSSGVARELDLRAERQQHAAKHGKTDHQHSMREKQGRCKRLYFDLPCGNDLLVASLVVSTASSQLALVRALMVGEDAGNADANAPDSTTL